MTVTVHTDAKEAQRELVRRRYAEAAQGGDCCCGGACSKDYTAEELEKIPPEAVLGLGSGNPVRAASLQPGETVLDLGSGGGVDVFLAASVVGPKGRAMGVDMTPEMLERARRAASARGNANVEFREGILEKLPVESLSVDAVLSNCVINLSPDKDAAFAEAYRALRAGGRLVLSDIVLDRPLTAAPTCGCVENADFRGVYLSRIRRAGFDAIEVVEDRPWSQEDGTVVASSVTLRATKPKSATH